MSIMTSAANCIYKFLFKLLFCFHCETFKAIIMSIGHDMLGNFFLWIFFYIEMRDLRRNLVLCMYAPNYTDLCANFLDPLKDITYMAINAVPTPQLTLSKCYT